MRHSNDERISELESQLGELREQEKQSAVDRRVSKQMEEIAYGQQILSEERSREAIRQSEIAQEMTLRSETERQKAIEAQGIAEMSAQEALNAYQMAERQRIEAEHAKLVADTLNYISLGRTLGSQSYSIYQTGDKELGNMLAYASYLYTHDYGGDLFIPSVFQALTQSAGGRRNWNVHNGGISCMEMSPKDNHLLTVSTYGEIFSHRLQDGQMQTTQQMSDTHYCFRDGFASKSGKDYAISYTGHLVVADGNKMRVIDLEKTARPFSLESMHDGNQLLIVGENSVALFDMATDKVIGTRPLGFRVVSTGRRDNKPLLFDNHGQMHLVNSLDDITNEKVPVSGQVSAFAASNDNRLTAYGMVDGTIWLTDRDGKTYKLVDHLSQVTMLEFDGNRLYSISYDGKMLFWMTGDSQIKPITLFQSNSWLTSFTFSTDKNYIWTGEYNGTITEYLISLPKIAQRLRQNVKRNFTQEEWNYYVGKGIPYRNVKE
jgi:WD40 repeat protein